MWLTQRGFAVSRHRSGGAALAAARAQAPDVVVVELMVPDGGVPLVRALRAEAGCRDAIIIVLTTQADPALREHALEAGADFYLVKPCGVLRLGEVMAIASRDRSRLVAPDTCGAKPSSARIRLALKRSRAIRERLVSNDPAPSIPPQRPALTALPGPHIEASGVPGVPRRWTLVEPGTREWPPESRAVAGRRVSTDARWWRGICQGDAGGWICLEQDANARGTMSLPSSKARCAGHARRAG